MLIFKWFRRLIDRISGNASKTLVDRPPVERMKSLRYPKLTGREWKLHLHAWMQTVYDTLQELDGSPKVHVPEPPDFNRAQRRLMKRFQLMLFFVPAWEEKDYPKSFVKPNWRRYIPGATTDPRIGLPGRWIAYEVIRKPDFPRHIRQDDRLLDAIGLDSRLGHPFSGDPEADDNLLSDILPMAMEVLNPLGGTTRIQSVEVSNLMCNIFHWLAFNTDVSLQVPNTTNSVEWTANVHGHLEGCVVGGYGYRDLAYVGSYWLRSHPPNAVFRFVVVF
ncbi:MAG: hypothetical protein AAB413_03445 [Patescibacteria group bacterium]